MSHYLCRHLCKPTAGQRFNFRGEQYELGAEVGDGAVGVVLKAVQLRSGATRAVKFLAPDPKYIEEAAFKDVASRFQREGLRGSGLDDPNLLRVYGHIENEDGCEFQERQPKNPFILMDYIKGRSLESYIRHLPSTERGIFVLSKPRLEIAIGISRALSYLHQKRMIHRDVKPANVFLPNVDENKGKREAILGDFGVVKWGDFRSTFATGVLTTTAQQGLGTMKYMSPEHALSAKTVTVRADVFSLGVTLYELFTGQILASPHHVFAVMSARMARGNAISRFLELGYRLPFECEDIGSMILDMHLRGIEGRPTIQTVLGKLEYTYNRIFEDPE